MNVKIYFPFMVNLHGRSCVVVGGGRVAERKIAALLESGAPVTVVSPACTDRIRQWIGLGLIRGLPREYKPGDAEGAFLVIAATSDEAVNAAVGQDAVRLGALVNRADRPEDGDTILPAVVRRGRLTIAVSTGGASPGTAAVIKSSVEEMFGEEYEVYLDFLHEFRSKLRERVHHSAQRQQMMGTVIQWKVLAAIVEGRFGEVADELLRLLDADPSPEALSRFGERSGLV